MSEIGRTVLQGLGQAAAGLARYLPEPVARGADFAAELAGAEGRIEVSPSYQQLLNRQIETQLELQQVTFISNIERSQHETRMSAVRNIRVN